MSHGERIFLVAFVPVIILASIAGSILEERSQGPNTWKAGGVGSALKRGFYIGAALSIFLLIFASLRQSN